MAGATPGQAFVDLVALFAHGPATAPAAPAANRAAQAAAVPATQAASTTDGPGVESVAAAADTPSSTLVEAAGAGAKGADETIPTGTGAEPSIEAAVVPIVATPPPIIAPTAGPVPETGGGDDLPGAGAPGPRVWRAWREPGPLPATLRNHVADHAAGHPGGPARQHPVFEINPSAVSEPDAGQAPAEVVSTATTAMPDIAPASSESPATPEPGAASAHARRRSVDAGVTGTPAAADRTSLGTSAPAPAAPADGRPGADQPGKPPSPAPRLAASTASSPIAADPNAASTAPPSSPTAPDATPAEPSASTPVRSDLQPAAASLLERRDDGGTAPVEHTVMATSPAIARPATIEAGRTAPAETTPLPLDDALPTHLVRSMRVLASQGGGEVRIRLQPELLGELALTIRVEHGAVSASLHSDVPEVRRWIESHAGSLRDALNEQGLQLKRLEVSEWPAARDDRDAANSRDARSRRQYQSSRRRAPRGPGAETGFDVEA